MASLSSSANYYNHRTFPGLVNWLFVLTEPELTGELGDDDRKGMHTGGIIRRPSSQLKPILHAGERRVPPPPERLVGRASSREQATVFKSICAPLHAEVFCRGGSAPATLTAPQPGDSINETSEYSCLFTGTLGRV